MDINFKLSKENFVFYCMLFISFFMLFAFSGALFKADNLVSESGKTENRVIKCQLPLEEGLVQNVYYVAPDLQTAKKQLFNAKNGLFFDNELFVKTVDFKGNIHVVPFSEVNCDSVGTQVMI
jgi:hypothetical protein